MKQPWIFAVVLTFLARILPNSIQAIIEDTINSEVDDEGDIGIDLFGKRFGTADFQCCRFLLPKAVGK